MKGYKLTAKQSEFLHNKTYGDGVFYNPIKDANGYYFIFEQEKNEAEILLNTTLINIDFVLKENKL